MSDPAMATLLFQEAAQAAQVVDVQRRRNTAVAQRLGEVLRARPPRAVITCARGSSDHAATYAKYLIETRTGSVVASAAPSVTSVYQAPQDLRGCLFIAISQSGRSPDLVASAQAARRHGAIVVALVNVEDSPLAQSAEFVFPLCAGPERSVAASKSFIAALAALLQLVAAWTGEPVLKRCIDEAPELLAQAWDLDWSPALETLRTASHLFVISRGLGLGVAQEAALKGKETCGLHAEAFSGAEVRHGPQALLVGHFPALMLVQDDETRGGLLTLAQELVERQVPVMLAGPEVRGALALPTLVTHPALEPLLMVQSYYRLVNALALARGRDPDCPPHLKKVTETH
jgi:glucosamine--fructose-6-phosphate aminotransferase (isomerizing)